MKTWNKKPITVTVVNSISAKYKIDTLTAVILARRGITEGNDIEFYLEDNARYLHNPFLFSNMEDVVDRILQAKDEGEKVLIPINMRDGSVLAVGKGNPEWNYSAPHGAGRVMSRSKAFKTLTLEEYQETMKGVYTTSVNENTLDEAPMAYKSLEDIIDVIKESVDVIDVMKPIYNFKASE